MKQYDEGTGIAGCRDSGALREMEADGYVPWELFAREQAWREELQHTLAQVFNGQAERGVRGRWPTKPEQVSRARERIAALLTERAELTAERDQLTAEMRELRARASQERAKLAELERTKLARAKSIDVTYQGGSLEKYVRSCRAYAVRYALDHTATVKEARQMLHISQSAMNRYQHAYGLLRRTPPQSA